MSPIEIYQQEEGFNPNIWDEDLVHLDKRIEGNYYIPRAQINALYEAYGKVSDSNSRFRQMRLWKGQTWSRIREYIRERERDLAIQGVKDLLASRDEAVEKLRKRNKNQREVIIALQRSLDNLKRE